MMTQADDRIAWIEHVADAAAEGRLKKLYSRIRAPDGSIDNIMLAHSLRPHTLEGHMALYKHTLHNTSNTLPKWFLETLGVYVSLLNHCEYCVEHHSAGLRRLLGDEVRADAVLQALHHGIFTGEVFSAAEQAALTYAMGLTQTPHGISESAIEPMRRAGLTDGEILEVNQVVAYFAYANRTVLGLGVGLAGDTLGLSPNSSEGNDWSHQ